MQNKEIEDAVIQGVVSALKGYKTKIEKDVYNKCYESTKDDEASKHYAELVMRGYDIATGLIAGTVRDVE